MIQMRRQAREARFGMLRPTAQWTPDGMRPETARPGGATVEVLIRLDSTPSSDGWGFVGRVQIGDTEAYRTIQAYVTPTEAQQAMESVLSAALRPMLAAQEWRSLQEASGRAPSRQDLGLSLGIGHLDSREEPSSETD